MKKVILTLLILLGLLKNGSSQTDGDIDISYGVNGTARFEMGELSCNGGQSLHVLPDNKILFGGYYMNGGRSYFTIVKFLQNGSVDLSFGTNGKSIVDINSSSGFVKAMVIQPDGKIILAGMNENTNFILVRFKSDGGIDTSFLHTGIVQTTMGTSSVQCLSVAVQANGKIVAGGCTSSDFAITRYLSNGVLDTSFSSDGKIITDMGGTYNDGISKIITQPDGKIVAVGWANSGAIARYNIDGSLDNTFSGDGKLTFTGKSNTGLLQNDGKIVVAGTGANTQRMQIARFNANGTFDNTFSGNGYDVLDTLGMVSEGNDIIQQPDGKFLIAGSAGVGSYNFFVYRCNTDGSRDYTFSNFGYMIKDLYQGYNDAAYTARLSSDGKIYVGGYSSLSFAVLKLNTNGAIDTTWCENGLKTILFNASSYAYGAARQIDGKIVIIGKVVRSASNQNNLSIIRLNANGSVDSTFADNGTFIMQTGSIMSFGNSVAIQPDGKIVCGGRYNTQFLILRLNSDGSLDNSFGTNGQVTTLTGFSDVNSLLIQPDGKIIAAGSSSPSGYGEFAICRYLTTGALDTSFSSDGIDVRQICSFTNFGKSVMLKENGEIYFAGFCSQGLDYRIVLLRYSPNGVPLNNKVYDLPGSGADEAYTVCIQPDDKIIIGGSKTNGAITNFVLLRLKTDLNYDSTFSSDGFVTTALSSVSNSLSVVKSIYIQNDEKIVAAGYSAGYFAICRYNSDGSLDNTFSGDGKVIEPNGTGYQLIAQPDGKFLLAGSRTINSVSGFQVVRYFGFDSTLTKFEVKKSDTDTIKIFPNPANEILTIESSKNGVIEIVNLQGQIVKTFYISSKITIINISKLSRGVYTMKMKTDKGIVVKKLIKQ